MNVDKRTLWMFGLAVFLVLAATSGNVAIGGGDSGLMCQGARSIVDGGLPSVPERARQDLVRGRDGKFYSNYPLFAIVQCVPAVVAEHAGRDLGKAGEWPEHLLVGLVPSFTTAMLAVGFVLLALAFGATRRGALALGALLVFTTLLWVQARTLYSENLQGALMLWTAVTFIAARRTSRRWLFVVGGVLLGLGVHTKVPLAMLIPIAPVYLLWGEPITRRKIVDALVLPALGGAPLLVLWLWFNDHRFGGPLSLGYSTDQAATIGFGTPLLTGLHGLLLSSGKSVFLYAPLLVVAVLGLRVLARRAPREAWCWVIVPAAAFVLVMSKWWAWSGDWSWGPRLIDPIVPLAFVGLVPILARPGAWRAIALALAAAGLVVQLVGISVEESDYLGVATRVSQRSLDIGGGGPPVRDDLAIIHFVPEFNPIVGHGWLLWRYVDGTPWHRDDWYPWRSVGIPAWRLDFDPTPNELNFWFVKGGSDAKYAILALLYVSAMMVAAVAWQLSRED